MPTILSIMRNALKKSKKMEEMMEWLFDNYDDFGGGDEDLDFLIKEVREKMAEISDSIDANLEAEEEYEEDERRG